MTPHHTGIGYFDSSGGLIAVSGYFGNSKVCLDSFDRYKRLSYKCCSDISCVALLGFQDTTWTCNEMANGEKYAGYEYDRCVNPTAPEYNFLSRNCHMYVMTAIAYAPLPTKK
jgi:hypothetical protein